MANIIDSINNWPANKKIAAVVLLLLCVSGLVLLVSWSQRPDYQLLFNGLSETDSGLIVQKLKDLKIPYKVNGGGIQVPSEKVYELRFQMAAEGIPQGGTVGFELFDKTDLGTTDFVQKLNYRRALQGELARTIISLKEVDSARVHLAIPERSLFMSQEYRPRASVVVNMKGGRSLSKEQVQGIVNLVSGSVEGMEYKDVTVVSNRGELLTAPDTGDYALSGSQSDYQHSYETDMEKRIIAMLEPVVGLGKVKAKVAAFMDFTKEESTEERYDPDGQVIRSEQRSTEKSSNPTRGGVPGVASNMPNAQTPELFSQAQSQMQNQVVNYEISKVVKRTVNAPGEVKRLTAAVLVDGSYADGGKEYTARSDEDLRRYEDLIRASIGYSSERGDDVKVSNMRFFVAPDDAPVEEKVQYAAIAKDSAKYLAPAIAVLLFALLVLRPLVKVITAQPKQAGEQAMLSGGAETPALPQADRLPRLETFRPGGVKGQVVEWADQNPQEAADLIRSWIQEK